MQSAVIGLDFGSLSCRGVLACPADGRVLAEAEAVYPHGVWTPSPGCALQAPEDFAGALKQVVQSLLAAPGARDIEVKALGLDCTASTVVPVARDGSALREEAGFAEDPDAWAIMWKDHRAAAEAEALTDALKKADPDLLARLGGRVGAEALLPKVMRLRRAAPRVYEAAFAFQEMGDWLVGRLIGRPAMSLTLLTCKALYRQGAGYFVPDLAPKLMPPNALLGRPGQPAGTLCPDMAARLGLSASTVVTFAQMDGYAGLPGVGVAGPGEMVMAVGTSTGFFLLDPADRPIDGVCAAVRDSMLPGFTGIAAGQAASGDAFAWYVRNCLPAEYLRAAEARGMDIHAYLCEKVAALPDTAPRPVALDWLNGNKSPLSRPDLTGVLVGLTLETRPEHIYRALMEATVFGARRIVDTLEEQGVAIHRVRAAGGIPRKNPLLTQLYADVLSKPVEVTACDQTAALGSAMAAAAAAEPGGYGRWDDIIARMGPQTARIYVPDPQRGAAYAPLYQRYRKLSDYFAAEGGNYVSNAL